MIASFHEALAFLRGCLNRQLNLCNEHVLQTLFSMSYDMIKELEQFRYRLSVALYHKLSEKHSKSK